MRASFGVSVVVPVFNSEAVLPVTISKLSNYLTDAFVKHEIIFIDDGSVDQSANILRAAAIENKNIRIYSHEVNRGQQQSLRDGFQLAKYEVILSVDADLPCALADLQRISLKAYNHLELVFGRRSSNRHQALWRKLGSDMANILFRLLYSYEIRDFGCSLAAMRRSLIEKLSQQTKPTLLIKMDLLFWAETYGEMEYQSPIRSTRSSYSFLKLLRLFWLMLTYRIQ